MVTGRVIQAIEPATILCEGLRRNIVGDDSGAVAGWAVAGDGEGGR